MSTQRHRQAAPPALLAAVSLVVHHAGGTRTELPTRVWDLVDTDSAACPPLWTVVVARPTRADGLPVAVPTAPAPGGGDGEVDEVDLTWSTETGVLRLPVAVTLSEHGYGPVWVLTPAGAISRHQRRSHFRVPVVAPLLLEYRPTLVEEPVRVAASVVDLAEGGLLGSLRSTEHVPDVGTPLRAVVALPEGTVRVDGTVVRVSELPGGTTGVALRFTSAGEAAGEAAGAAPAVLRRALMRIQRQRARERSA